MRITQLYIKNFKRFSDLLLTHIPEDTRLVLLIGTNGSGKSCVFDAFEYVASGLKETAQASGPTFYADQKYYGKNEELATEVFIETNQGNFRRHFHGHTGAHSSAYTGDLLNPDTKFYGRSAVRFQPRLQKTVIGTPIQVLSDTDRPAYYIDRDFRFENDIDLLLMEVVQKVFSDLNHTGAGGIDSLKAFLNRINEALARIFSHSSVSQLRLVNFATPAEGNPAQLIFKKGQSTIQYDFLSAGEKEIINLLINLYTRTQQFGDALYFIDEMDAHLNTTLQYKVIQEITENWIPQGGQLWTASHSLGFIQYAKDCPEAAIFDLDDLDFDTPQVLVPEAKEKAELYEIAVSKDILPALFRQFTIVFVENEDRNYYASLHIPHTLFIGEKNRDSVFHKTRAENYAGLIDKDFLTAEDCTLLKEHYAALHILQYYCVENYLYHPDNMAAYFAMQGLPFDKANYIERITEEKEKAKDSIIVRIATVRQSYPFFKEPEARFSALRKRFAASDDNYAIAAQIAEALRSREFEVFYPYFSMKTYAKTIAQRQHISPIRLSETRWFSNAILQQIT